MILLQEMHMSGQDDKAIAAKKEAADKKPGAGGDKK